jgi:hypothetical protein
MRIEGWERLLAEYIRQVYDSVFVWGQNDCALWCADWVKLATGQDLAAEWRGQYASEDELRALMEQRRFPSYEAIADSTGFAVVSVKFAQRGDIVLSPDGPLGICNGMISHFIMEKGMTRLPTLRCAKAWKVE